MVGVQLAERSLPIPEIRGSNPDIGNEIIKRDHMSIAIQKRRNKKERKGPFKKE